MVIQLPTGKVIEISVEQYLSMSDDTFLQEMEEVVAHNYGEAVEDPFFRSAITGTQSKKICEDEEHEPSIDEISAIEKYEELDLDSELLEE